MLAELYCYDNHDDNVAYNSYMFWIVPTNMAGSRVLNIQLNVVKIHGSNMFDT